MNALEAIRFSSHFRRSVDSQSGAVSYLLENQTAPLQQSFYFVNDPFSADGRYFWFYCAFPPSGDANRGRVLGVVDLVLDTVTCFPDTQFCAASPWVEPETGWIYWTDDRGLYRRSPEPSKHAETLFVYPAELYGSRGAEQSVTHLTRSADGQKLFLDLYAEGTSYLGTYDLHTGEYERWYAQPGPCYNHAQFSPTDPDLVLLAEEFYWHPTRLHVRCDPQGRELRLWTLRRGEGLVNHPTVFSHATHERWSADGRTIYYVDVLEGICAIDLATGQGRLVHACPAWHPGVTADERRVCWDVTRPEGCYRGCATSVWMADLDTEKEWRIADVPALYTREHPSTYHIDPHPRFVLGDRAVCYTATATGTVTAAICLLEHE